MIKQFVCACLHLLNFFALPFYLANHSLRPEQNLSKSGSENWEPEQFLNLRSTHLVFLTQPLRPSELACCWVNFRKNTPWTLPNTCKYKYSLKTNTKSTNGHPLALHLKIDCEDNPAGRRHGRDEVEGNQEQGEEGHHQGEQGEPTLEHSMLQLKW